MLLPAAMVMGIGCAGLLAAEPVAEVSEPSDSAGVEWLRDGFYAVWHTPRGRITAEIFFQDVPLAAANFVGLAEGSIPFNAPGRAVGKPYFDGLTFHRVVPWFVVQGGDPVGTGEGSPGYEFADEFSPKLKHDATGTLAMANDGPNTNGSQFYFTLEPRNRLDYMHTVFGRVVRGLEVLPRWCFLRTKNAGCCVSRTDGSRASA